MRSHVAESTVQQAHGHITKKQISAAINGKQPQLVPDFKITPIIKAKPAKPKGKSKPAAKKPAAKKPTANKPKPAAKAGTVGKFPQPPGKRPSKVDGTPANWDPDNGDWIGPLRRDQKNSKGKTAARPAAAGSAKKKPPASASSKKSSPKRKPAAKPEKAAKKVKKESIEIVPDGARDFLDFLQDEIAGESMGLLTEPSNEGSVCDQLHTLFLRKPWKDQCQIKYDNIRGKGKSNRRPDFQFKPQNALLEVKYKRQSTNQLKDHLLAQVCDYLANEDEKALDVWTCYYEHVPSISFEADTEMQKDIDELAGRAQGREDYIRDLGKTWPRLWRMSFR